MDLHLVRYEVGDGVAVAGDDERLFRHGDRPHLSMNNVLARLIAFVWVHSR